MLLSHDEPLRPEPKIQMVFSGLTPPAPNRAHNAATPE
jgi:hypothetical protein